MCAGAIVLARVETVVFGAPDPRAGGVGTASLALLGPAAPNPARSRAVVSFSLSTPGPVTVSVYDISGRQVAMLLDGSLDAGPHEAAWDFASSGDVASGIYFYRVTSRDEHVSGKMVVLR